MMTEKVGIGHMPASCQSIIRFADPAPVATSTTSLYIYGLPARSKPSSHMSDDTRTITLYTAPTPNGFSTSILLEELKLVYPSLAYE